MAKQEAKKKSSHKGRQTEDYGQQLTKGMALLDAMCLHGPCTLQDLADHLKMHTRTIHRMIKAWKKAGVRIYAMREVGQPEVWIFDHVALRERFCKKDNQG